MNLIDTGLKTMTGGRLKKSEYASELLSSDNSKIIDIRSNQLIKLNEERKSKLI